MVEWLARDLLATSPPRDGTAVAGAFEGGQNEVVRGSLETFLRPFFLEVPSAPLARLY